MPHKFACIFPVIFVSACAIDHLDAHNVSAYCTPDNAYRLGSQSKAYYGGCPKESETRFLAALQRGRALRAEAPDAELFRERMEELEKQLVATDSEVERQRLRAQLRDAEWWAIHMAGVDVNAAD